MGDHPTGMRKLTDGGNPKFQPLCEEALGSAFTQTIMPLFKRCGDEFLPIGTGFVVGVDGLLITAKHVVLDAVKQGAQITDIGRRATDAFEAYALWATDERHGPNNEHRVGGFLPIQKAWCDALHDIGWCFLSPLKRDGKQVLFKRMRLSPGLPNVGDEISAFGYHGLAGPLTTDSDGKPIVNYNQKGSFTRGRILEVHVTKRDSAMLNFPCFRTDARFDPGMSGGPVANEAGRVCGVICSSFGGSSESEYISYASLLWPVLESEIDAASAPGEPARRIKIKELVRVGYIVTDGSESKINIVTNESL